MHESREIKRADVLVNLCQEDDVVMKRYRGCSIKKLTLYSLEKRKHFYVPLRGLTKHG